MGFYFRKSFGNGPFRVNFSKSGVSYSAGFKGARINFSNRGTYVNFGSNGIYYRKKISGSGQNKHNQTPEIRNIEIHDQHTITSSNIEEITDTDSKDFINELTEKSRKVSYFDWFGILPLILSIFILLYTFFASRSKTETVEVTHPKVFIQSLSKSNTNVRQSPDKKGFVLGVLNHDEKFQLLDDSQSDWYKIDFNGIDGFVSKKYAEKIAGTIKTKEFVETPSATFYERNRILFWSLLISLIILFSILLPYLKKIDNKRLLIEIYYELDENIMDVYKNFVQNFSALLNCSRVWQYLHSEKTNDYKYSSGASHTVIRKPLSRIFTNKSPSKIFKTNVQIPYLGLINTELYFFPERLIIKRGDEFGAIMYKNIECYVNTTRFIETEGVPADSIVVDHTWRYLNKNGSPDRRFNNNYQIPICQYSEYAFKSTSGLNEKISTSKVGGIDEFIKYIKAIGLIQKNIPTEATDIDIKPKNLLN